MTVMVDEAKGSKLDDLEWDEVSGVDHPAHRAEGWLAIKAAGLPSRLPGLSWSPEEAVVAAAEGQPAPATGPTCPECGAGNRPGARFCATCGAVLNEDPTLRAARKARAAAATRVQAAREAAWDEIEQRVRSRVGKAASREEFAAELTRFLETPQGLALYDTYMSATRAVSKADGAVSLVLKMAETLATEQGISIAEATDRVLQTAPAARHAYDEWRGW